MRAFHDGNIVCLPAIDSGSGPAGGICAGVCVCVFVSVCSVSFSWRCFARLCFSSVSWGSAIKVN